MEDKRCRQRYKATKSEQTFSYTCKLQRGDGRVRGQKAVFITEMLMSKLWLEPSYAVPGINRDVPTLNEFILSIGTHIREREQRRGFAKNSGGQ